MSQNDPRDLFGYQQRQIADGIDLDYTTWSRDGKTMLGRD